MSNYLAIATVTAALKKALAEYLVADGLTGSVETVQPNTSGEGLPSEGVNICLYQVMPNPHWRNQDLPTRRSDGRLVQRPQVAIDLHYLFSFYGPTDLAAQRLSGSTLCFLHANPVLSCKNIKAVTDANSSAYLTYLEGSDLHKAVELVKFTPLALSLDEMSKLWSIFFQAPYALSVAYTASVVFIDAKQDLPTASPVLERNIELTPYRNAVIDSVISASGDSTPIVFKGDVLIKGRHLGGKVKAVRVGGVELEPEPGHVTNTRIAIKLDDAGLRAGVHGVQVIYKNGIASNAAPLVLRPIIVKDNDTYKFPTEEKEEPDIGKYIALSATLAPTVGKDQRVMLYLDKIPTDDDKTAYRFAAVSRDTDTSTVTFKCIDVLPGNYLVRVQVDGAETLLETDGGGVYNAPIVEIPELD